MENLNPRSDRMAITYVASEYDTRRQHLMGRHSASESFLRSWIQTADPSTLCSFSLRQEDHLQFNEKVSQWNPSHGPSLGLLRSKDLKANNVGALYTPDPNLSKGLRQRQALGTDSFSMIGVTHTLSSDGAMDLVGQLATSPVEPWDALICTSQAVKTVVEKLLERKLEDLKEHFGLTQPLKPTLPQFPIIPLGVEIDKYPKPEDQPKVRDQWRQKLGIPHEAIVSLFMGRLSFHAKAHPYPMLEALGRCSQMTDQPLTLILCGWFANDATQEAFQEAANLLCPKVQLLIVDGRDPEVQSSIWSASDLFISLSDNIQETFGLTPLEAKANGLPVVISDWNGYRETVQHGIDEVILWTNLKMRLQK